MVRDHDAFQLYIPSPLREQIERIADEEDLTRTTVVLDLLREALASRHEQEE